MSYSDCRCDGDSPAGDLVTQLYIPRKNFVLTSDGLIAPEWDRSFLQPLVQTVIDGLSTSITGILKGDGTAVSAATAGTDYSTGTSGLATGILKSTITTGALSTAVAGDFPTLNQNTTGSAGTLSPGRTIAGVAFNGSVNIAVASTGLSDTTNLVRLNAANSFSLINPLTTIAESWIGPSSTAGMYFKGGNVGIGTTVPGAKLAVISSANDLSDGIRIDASDYATNGGYLILNKNSGSATYATIQSADNGTFRSLSLNPSGGYVGIGTTNPKSPLHVVGLPIYANNAAAVTGGLTAGAFYRTGADPDPVCVVH